MIDNKALKPPIVLENKQFSNSFYNKIITLYQKDINNSILKHRNLKLL